MRYIAAVLACLMLLATFAVPVDASEDDNTCSVLFDFGNGEIGWASVDVEPGMNAFNITVEAAEQLGYQLTVSYFGVNPYIDAIDGHFPDYSDFSDMIYWGFYTWNETTSVWDSSWVGASDVDGSSVTAIAWSYTALPTATPDHKYPWTSFRGDSANGGSQEAYAPNNLTSAYQKDLAMGSIESPIISANGLTYVVCSGIVNYTTWGHDTNSTIVCLDEDGDEVWSAEIGKGFQTGAPLMFNGKVIVSSADGNVSAFDALTGELKWTFDLGSGEVYGAPSPVGDTNRIYVASANGDIFCFKDSGELDWTVSLGTAIYSSSPAVGYDMLFIGAENGTLNAIDLSTGSLSWSEPIGGKVRGTPALLDGNVIVTYTNYTGTSADNGGVAAVDVAGTLMWQTETGVTTTSVVLTGDGIVTNDATTMYMLNTDGEIQWELGLGTQFSGGAPSYVSGTIYLVTNEASSRLLAVSVDGEMYVNKYLEPSNYALCAPTVADGRLYVSSDAGYIYVFDMNNVSPDASNMIYSNGLTTTFELLNVEDGTLFSYVWDFGDNNGSTERSTTHEYAEAGSYTVKVTVTAPNGESQTLTSIIDVQEEETSDSGDMVIWFAVIGVIVIIAALAFVMLRRRK